MITLVGRKIAVKPILDPDKSQGGNKFTASEAQFLREQGIEMNGQNQLLIPEIAKERTDQGIVSYVGPKCKDVQVGDWILFSAYTGSTVQFEIASDGIQIIFDERFAICKLNNPDTNVNGLYFRGAVDAKADAEMDFKFDIVLAGFKQSNFSESDVKKVFMQEYMKRESNRYFTATYEMSMNLIAESFRHTEFAKGVGIKNPMGSKPATEDYNELEEDD